MPDPGVDVFVLDEFLGGAAALATDTLFILSPNGITTPVKYVRADHANATVNNQLRAYFHRGGRSVYVQGYGDGVSLPLIPDAIAKLPAGPGQVVAPEAVTSADMISIANASWAANKVALLNAPSGATISALQTLSAAVIAGAVAGGRGAGLWRDYGLYPGATAGAADVTVPVTIEVAAMIAENDRRYRNPNLAAAGVRGVSRANGMAIPLVTSADRSTLKTAQVNTYNDVWGERRNYGFRTLANLGTHPHWWDLSGSRTVMGIRARSAVIDEGVLFDQIDGQRVLIDRYEGLLRSACKELYDLGALYGQTPAHAYSVDTSEIVNPIEDIAEGELEATIRLKTSPHAEHVITNIVKRQLTAAEL